MRQRYLETKRLPIRPFRREGGFGRSAPLGVYSKYCRIVTWPSTVSSHLVYRMNAALRILDLAQLDKLPPKGFYLVVAPMKIETGSGGPARVFAVFAKGEGEN